MRLYEINSEIENLILNATDPETGEISESALEELINLNMEKEQKMENLLLYIKDLKTFKNNLKEEKANITDRMAKVDNKITNLENFAQHMLNGEKFNTTKVAVSYRKSKSVELKDNFLDWAIDNCKSLVRTKYEADKTKITELLKQGEEVPYAELVEKTSMTIK